MSRRRGFGVVARQRAIVRGELPPKSNSKLSFDDAVEQWLDSRKARKARAHVSYKASMRSYLKPTFGTMLLAAISSAEIMDWRDELSTRFAPATVNGALIALSSAFTYFAKRGWVAKNPARGVEHIKAPDRAYEWVRTREDITKLLLECPRGIREIATVAVCTGMRLDELLHLHWSDVDLERRLITSAPSSPRASDRPWVKDATYSGGSTAVRTPSSSSRRATRAASAGVQRWHRQAERSRANSPTDPSLRSRLRRRF